MSSGQRTIKIAFAGSTAGLDKATEGARRSLDSVSESTDNLDTKASGATSALGALSSGFELVGLQGFADGLNSAAMATDFFSGLGEGLTLILESQALATARAKIAAIGKAVADKTAAAASKAWAAAQWLLNAAMSANPIALVIIAIVALIAIFVIAWKHSETFRRIVTAAWNGIKAAAQAVAKWFTGTLLPALSAVWSKIQAGAAFFVRYVKAQFTGWKNAAISAKNGIVSAFNHVVSFFRGMPGKIGRAASGMFNGIKNAFRSAVNWIIGKWNNLSFGISGKHVSLPFGKSFDVPGFRLNTPNIGYLAAGGAAIAGRTYLVGEKGPELLEMGSTSGHVTPNKDLGGVTEVRVFIGDTELKGMVRTEIREHNRGIRRAATAGIGGAW